MRIVLVTAAFPQLSETFIVSKFLGLLARGWDVHMVCGESDPAQWANYPALQQHPDVRRCVHQVWPHRPRWLALMLLPLAVLVALAYNFGGTRRYWREGQKRWGLAGMLRRLYLDLPLLALKPDLVHFEFGALAVGREALNDLLGCKVAVSFRGYDLNFTGLEQPDYYAATWQQADAIHLLGQDLWQRALRRGCPPDKLHAFIAPAIDVEQFFLSEPRPLEVVGTVERPLRILSVGRLEWKKGYEYALQAVKLLQAAGVVCQLRMVGSGSYHEAIVFARHQLGLDDTVELLGGLPRHRVIDQLRWADVFLHASLSEGFCNVVVEAQAMQLPVVCSDAGGLQENVADGETGFVVPRRNPAALAERLALLADPARRDAMGKAGRERVLHKFQLKDQINAFEQFYQQVLECPNK
jgi:colanic acid/amylovoran biosynthesis glycosyltransferase